MRLHNVVTVCLALGIGALTGCSSSAKTPDVSRDIRNALDQSGLKDVSEEQDRGKGVITLGGHVTSEEEKIRAESIARSFAGGQVVANQVAVLVPGSEGDIKKIDTDLDKGIEKNLDAALIQGGFASDVKYTVKNSVVTLSGSVDSQGKRTQVEKLASTVPNVQQVVNELQVKDQKATTTR